MVHSLLDDTPPRPCTWDHMSTDQGDSPHLIEYLGSPVHSLQGNLPSQTLHLMSHVHSFQGDNF